MNRRGRPTPSGLKALKRDNAALAGMEEWHDIDPSRFLIDTAAGSVETHVIDQAAMAEDGPFGKAGRPGCVLDLCPVFGRNGG